MSSPFGCSGGVQWRIISVSEGLSSVRDFGGPGTGRKHIQIINDLLAHLDCLTLTLLLLSDNIFFVTENALLLNYLLLLLTVLLLLTPLISFEGQRLRRRSFALAVEHCDFQDIMGVRPETIDHFRLLVGTGLYHPCGLWFSGPAPTVVSPQAFPGQMDLEPKKHTVT